MSNNSLSNKKTSRNHPISNRAEDILNRIKWDSLEGCKHLNGFNYQPSWGHNAETIWLDNFDAEKYRFELLKGKEYFPSFNCVRIWLGYGAFKKDPDKLRANFNTAVDICTNLELLVIPILFTIWGGTPPFDPVKPNELIGIDYEHEFGKYIDSIITPHRSNKSILAWDLCNEPTEDIIYFNDLIGDENKPPNVSQEIPRSKLAELIDWQMNWLKFVHERVKKIDPGAKTCVGSASDFGWGRNVEELCDIITPHLYGYFLWKMFIQKDRTNVSFDSWFEASVCFYIEQLRMRRIKKPVLSTETCWGSLDDKEREEIIHTTLRVLKYHRIGFMPHALNTSPVADLHPPELGPVSSPGYMAFIRSDGTLRPGHDVFNEFGRMCSAT